MKAPSFSSVASMTFFLRCCIFFGDQFDAIHRTFLSDAVRAVGRLIFNGRVPPRVVVDHHVGPGQVESASARLEAD